MDIRILKQYIKYDFLNKFIQLFNSKIEDEKKELKLILHKLYSKLVCRRKLIRNLIENYLTLPNIQLNKYNGVKEFVEVIKYYIRF